MACERQSRKISASKNKFDAILAIILLRVYTVAFLFPSIILSRIINNYPPINNYGGFGSIH